MAQAVHPKYRAFLVHAPADEAWGRTLQRSLEEMRVPWALVGRETAHGPVPKRIGPLARFAAEPPPVAPGEPEPAAVPEPSAAATPTPAEPAAEAAPGAAADAEPPAAAATVAGPTLVSSTDAPVGPAAPPEPPALRAPARPTLPEDMVAALVDARFLVVLCSPAAATDAAVDEAVRRYKGLGRGDRVVAVLVGGAPDADPRTLCPPALRRRIKVDGTVSDEEEDAVAPLVIDARTLPRTEVTMRLAAALLALSFDEFRGPAERSTRGRRRLRGWLTAAAVLLILVGGLVAAVRFVLPNDPMLLDRVLAAGTGTTLRAVDAADRLGASPAVVAGIVAPAEAALRDLAAAGGDDPRLQLRRAAMLIAFERRRDALGLADAARSRTTAAEALLDGLVFPGGMDAEVQREIVAARLDAVRLRLAQGATDRALANARAALAAAERLAGADPTSVARQRELSRAATAFGDALLAAGEADDALKQFRTVLTIRETLLAVDPSSAEARRDLSVAYERLGDVLVVRDAPDEALKGYRTALSLRLSAVDPAAGPGWQRGLSILYNKVGDVQLAQGAGEDALGSYRAGLALQLAVAERADAAARRAMSVSYERIGDVLRAQRAFDEALASYRASLALRQGLAGGDPGGSRWPRDLPVSQERIGDVLMAKGAPDEALAAYQTALAARERLLAAQPGPAARHDVAVTQSKIGDALAARRMGAEALASWRAALAATEQLVAADPDNAAWQWEMAVLQWRLASAGDDPVERYRVVVATLRELAGRRKLTPAQAKWLPLAERALVEARTR